MRRWLIAGGAVVVGVLVVRRLASGCSGLDFGKIIERMPDDAPPKWMFRNIVAIRENTDRLLELLEKERATAPVGEAARAA